MSVDQAAVAASGVASAPWGSLPLRREPELEPSAWFGTLGLALVLAIVWSVILYKRRARGQTGWRAVGSMLGKQFAGPKADGADRLRVLTSTRLGPTAHLHVVQWEDQRLLVAVTAGTATLLSSRDTPGEASTERET